MRYVKLVFAMLLLVAVLAFVAGNTTPVTLHFLVWETPGVSLSLVAAGFFLLGILFTLLLGLLLRFRRSSAARGPREPKESNEPRASQPPEPVATPPADVAATDPLAPRKDTESR